MRREPGPQERLTRGCGLPFAAGHGVPAAGSLGWVLRLPFELGLALRYLRPKRNFVSVITLLCVAGVALGVSVLIIVIAVMTGFDLELRRTIIGFNAHLKVGTPGRPLAQWEEAVRKTQAVPGVRGAAPFVLGQVLMQTQPDPRQRASQSSAPIVRGIDPALEGRVSVLTNKVVSGSLDLRGQGLLMGASLADQLGVRVGDRVALHSTHALGRMLKSKDTGQRELSPAEDFEVRGLFEVGYEQIDAQVVVTSLANAQDLFALGDDVSGVTVMLHDSSVANTRALQRAVEDALGPEHRSVAWMDENRDLLGAIEVEKDVMLVILFVVMLGAGFWIICSQIAFVIRKTREIGILKAMGATTSQVVGVFLAQSSLVGFLGVLSGLALGTLGVAIRNDFLLWMRRLTGRELFPQSIYSFSQIPAEVLPSDVALICGVSLAMCLMAGVVPSWIAASMRPVEALRNE